MFGLPNPYIILAFVCALIGVYGYGHHQGYQEKSAEDAVEISRLNAESLEKEHRVADKFTQINTQLRKAKDEIKSKQDNINSRIDSGELRLPSSCAVQSSSDTASGDRDKGSESDRQAIKDIVSIASDGDSAIKDLNACISKYNEVRDTFNKANK
jgi:hypothetical protein